MSPRCWEMWSWLIRWWVIPSTFLQGVALGAVWLAENRVDACLVFGAEETNWIIADALWHLDRRAIVAAGAGALCLCRDAKLSIGVELSAITDMHSFSARQSRVQAAQAMRRQLEKIPPANCCATALAKARARKQWNERRLPIGSVHASAPKRFLAKG